MTPRIGELFAGYGGLGMGVQAVFGGRVVWVSDVCKFNKDGTVGHHTPCRAPCSILAHRLGVPNHGDVSRIDWSTVEPVDILTGGSPCQDLSTAGRRAGMTEGTRSNLWVAMREAVAQLRPGLVVWENVRGAYSAEAASDLESRSGLLGDVRRRDGEPVLRALGRVVGDLSDLGYDCRWVGLPASDIGAPHARIRVFLAAEPRSVRRGAWRPTGPTEADSGRPPTDAPGRGDTPLSLYPTPSAMDYKSGNTPGDLGRNDPPITAVSAFFPEATLLPTPSVADSTGGHLSRSGSRRDELLLPGVAKMLGTESPLLPTPRAGDGDKGGPNQAGSSGDLMLPSAVQPQRWGVYEEAVARWSKATRSAPSPVEQGSRGNVRLAGAFAEWMMGLPEGHVTEVPGVTRNEVLKACGNGVVPQQATEALHRMGY